MKFNARVARGKAYFAKRVKSNKARAKFVIMQLRAKNKMVKLAAKLAARREARYNKKESRSKKMLKLTRHKESVAKAAKAALSKAKYQKSQEKAKKMKKKAEAAKKKAAEAAAAAAAASKAEAAATKASLAHDAAIKSCPFTGPEMCQDKKKNHKCVKTNAKKGPWMGSDFVTCTFKKPAAAADAGLAWSGFDTSGGFKETKFSMPSFEMPALPKFSTSIV